jgi:hypothetical protein
VREVGLAVRAAALDDVVDVVVEQQLQSFRHARTVPRAHRCRASVPSSVPGGVEREHPSSAGPPGPATGFPRRSAHEPDRRST